MFRQPAGMKLADQTILCDSIEGPANITAVESHCFALFEKQQPAAYVHGKCVSVALILGVRVLVLSESMI